jgi:universal stress protein A
MKTILTPIDFSDVTAHVVAEALKLAQTCDGCVALLHVVRVPQAATEFAMELANVAELTASIERAADQQLAEVKNGLEARGAATQTVRVTGYPAVEIIEQAKKLSAAYIVMGSHGHTAFYDLVIGSTASAVIKRAPCPVVIVPAPQKPAPVTHETMMAPPIEAL